MKKFITRLIVFILLFFVMDCMVGMLFATVENKLLGLPPTYNTITDHAMKKVESDVLIVGASNASHHYVPQIIEDSLRLTTFNGGKDGNFFLYQTAVINYITNRYSPKIIIWEFYTSWLSTPNDNSDEIGRLSGLNSYYNGNNYIKNLINTRSKYEKYKMLCQSYRYNGRIFGYVKTALGLEKRDKGYSPLPNTGYKYPVINTDRKIIENNVDEDRVNRFINTLSICKEKEIQLVIALSPHLSNNNYNETSQILRMKEIADSMQVPVIDNFHNSFFMNDSTLFRDASHLNDKGAHIYTKMFIPQLKKALSIQ